MTSHLKDDDVSPRYESGEVNELPFNTPNPSGASSTHLASSIFPFTVSHPIPLRPLLASKPLGGLEKNRLRQPAVDAAEAAVLLAFFPGALARPSRDPAPSSVRR